MAGGIWRRDIAVIFHILSSPGVLMFLSVVFNGIRFILLPRLDESDSGLCPQGVVCNHVFAFLHLAGRDAGRCVVIGISEACEAHTTAEWIGC